MNGKDMKFNTLPVGKLAILVHPSCETLGNLIDQHLTNWRKARETDDGYLLSGRMEIDKVNSMFGLDIPESDEYMTIGGLILSKAKGFPKVNEKIVVGDYSLRILKKGETKIELVELTKAGQ